MSKYPLEQRLEDAGKATRRAAEDRDTAHRLLRRAVNEAASKDWPNVKIAETAGVSRQTVYNILGPR